MLLRKVCQVPQRCQLHQLSNQGLCQALSYSHEMSSIIHFDFGCPLKETSIGLHVPFWFMIIHVPNLFMCKSMIYTALNCTLQTILIQSYIIYVYVFFSKNNCLSVFLGLLRSRQTPGAADFPANEGSAHRDARWQRARWLSQLTWWLLISQFKDANILWNLWILHKLNFVYN